MDRRIKEKRFKLQTRKPSIKITVSADLPDSDNLSPDTPTLSDLSNLSSVRKIVSFGGEGSVHRVTMDDSSVIDFPACIDFGIKDFLCCKDEVCLTLIMIFFLLHILK